MKIGIMTMHRILNYGSYLQAFGLKRLIEEMGHEVIFVDYKVEASVGEQQKLKKQKSPVALKKICNKIKIGKNKALRIIRREKNSFACFISDFEKKYLRTLGISKEKQYCSQVDVLVIGSDEVFNCTQGEKVGFSKELFGAHNQAGKVISYAASFGNTTMEKLKKYNIDETIAPLLNKFTGLSVRDLNSYNIIKSLIEKDADMHLDPVLIYDFRDDIKDTVKEKDYIIVYAYNHRMTKEEGEAIRKFANDKNKKLIAISGEQDFCDEYRYCEPLEMLSYFKHADYVVTDTFHGTIFSVINHVPFATIIREDEKANGYGNQEKLGYLLEKLNLVERQVQDMRKLGETLDEFIDFEPVDELIKKERTRTREYLENQFQNY